MTPIRDRSRFSPGRRFVAEAAHATFSFEFSRFVQMVGDLGRAETLEEREVQDLLVGGR